MKTHCGKKLILAILILAVSVFLAGCAAGEENASNASKGGSAQTIDWSTCRIAPVQDVENADQWYLREYHDDWVTPLDWEHDRRPSSDYSAFPGGNIYGWFTYGRGNVEDDTFERLHCMDVFDVRTDQSFHTEVDTSGWGLPENSILSDMDMADEQEAVFLVRGREEAGTPLSCFSLFFYHMEEGLQKTLDLLPAMADAGITENRSFIYDGVSKYMLCDRDGRCYLIWGDELIVIDGNGDLLCNMEQPGEVALSWLCKTANGFPIFVYTDAEKRTNTYWIYDHDAGEMRCLGETKDMALNYSCMDSAGNLYYLSKGSKLVRWDIQSGKRETIYDCKAHSMCTNITALKVTCLRENGDLVIMDPYTDNKDIYVLSPTPSEDARTLTLVSTYSGNQLERTAASFFSMKNPNATIEISECSNWEEQEAYTTNLVNRIVAGDAPDMFIVSEETMRILYEKGALADLTDAIPDQVREQVFDCVWNAGTIDGKLIGLTTDLS